MTGTLVIGMILCMAAGIFSLYLWLLSPCCSRKERMKPFEDVLIAHRGLFDNESDAPENSMAAFGKAVEAGFGIELDVQMTADGHLVVFHDLNLKRMTGMEGRVTDHTLEELSAYTLGNSGETIPLFSDVLKMVDGRVPLVIEIKVLFRYRATTEAVERMLRTYGGVYCMECFNPLVLAWYRKHDPSILRGQLSEDYTQDEIRMPRLTGFILTNMLLNFLARPDFISYNHRDKKKYSFRICRKLFKGKTAAWTIQSQGELEAARDMFDVFIFDSFLPVKPIMNRQRIPDGPITVQKGGES